MPYEAPKPLTAEEMMKGWENIEPAAALDELQREINVRIKCFPRWIADGRLSNTDAKDRLQRLIKAGELCSQGLTLAQATG